MTERPSDIRRRLRAAGINACAWLALLTGPAVAAVSADDLLPVDEAFVLSAQASGPEAIGIHWRIADGYYLYRHRTSVRSDAGFEAGALQLPNGEAYEDEFFGAVETYRTQLRATLPGRVRAAAATLTVKYQGCADAGICYPPQTREIRVALPGGANTATGRPVAGGALVDAVDAAAGAPALGLPSPGGAALSNPVPGTPATGALTLPGNAAGGLGLGKPLPPEQAFGFEAIANDGNTLLLRFTPARGYYLYRDRTGLTTGTGGVALGMPRWPPGEDYHDEHFGDVVVYFTPVEVAVPLQRTQAAPLTVRLTATFQGCQTGGICYPPMTRTVDVSVPAGTVAQHGGGSAGGPPAQAAGTSRNAVAAAATATPADTVSPDGSNPAGASEMSAADPEPETAGRLPGVGSGEPSAAADGTEPSGQRRSLVYVLLLALGGGLILNLMPCVLPVLSLKALSLAGGGEDPGRARRQALWYTAGVVLSFAALGALALTLREAGLALGWGFQLQQPLVVAALALVMLALGLSLSGVWHLGGRWMGAGHTLATRSGATGDFFTGVLAVVVATPCTAPFMGAALAWAFTAPTATAMAVFLVLGLGLALPFLLIGFIPALARLLPRPGAWMETFKQLLAFPLYLTAVWLAWVLANQRGADAIGWWMVAAVLLAFAAWAWTRSRHTGRAWTTAAAVLAVVALAWPLRAIHGLPAAQATVAAPAPGSTDLVAVPYSAQRLADLRASGRVVFVNVTADWCVTCKANEKAVLARDGFRDALAAADAVYMVGDWTSVDPALTEFLQQYQAVGVPLYVVFPGEGAGRVLPTVLTPEIARSALAAASETSL